MIYDLYNNKEIPPDICGSGTPGNCGSFAVGGGSLLKQVGQIEGSFDSSGRVYSDDGAAPTINTCGGGNREPKVQTDHRIRKLTERECFRLQGVKNEDFDNIARNQAASSLYHLAGDSIEVSCLMAIFGEMLGVDYEAKIDELVENVSTDFSKNT